MTGEADDPWRFAGLAAAQRAAVRSLDWWRRLQAHDHLLATAELLGGDRLRRRLDEPRPRQVR